MKILGIDPGYERLGIAILEKSKKGKACPVMAKPFYGARNKIELIFSETFKTSAKDSHPERLFQIQKEVERVIKKHKPERLGIETLFFNKNVKTAIRVAEARGIILAIAKKYGLEIREISPQQIKIAVTGYGNANKDSIIKMVSLLINFKNNKIKLDDEFDAIASAISVF